MSGSNVLLLIAVTVGFTGAMILGWCWGWLRGQALSSWEMTDPRPGFRVIPAPPYNWADDPDSGLS